MEHKLLAIGNCEGEGICRESMIDRFSNLPDGVAHHILSFLCIRDLTRFGIASKRCRELYLSTLSLDFDGFLSRVTVPPGEFWCFSEVTCEVRLNLMNSLDRFLLQRGDSKIQCFRLMWEGHYVEDSDETPCVCVNEHFRIITWIHNAVRCNVEVLHVKCGVHDFEEDQLAFPSCVFLCETLRSLVVDINHTIVKTPSVAFSSNLECLKLHNVDIEDMEFFKWISRSCKFLKDLFLCDIWKTTNITIESSSLENFGFVEGALGTHRLNISGQKLEDITIYWLISSHSNVSLNICAPNLKSLSLEGNLMNRANVGKLECLEKATICMEPKVDGVDGSNNLFEVLCKLNMAEEFVLSEATIKALFTDRSTYAQLDNLFELHMRIRSFSDELVPAVVSLLRGMPNLCTLSISCHPRFLDPTPDASGFDMEYWKLQNLAFIDQIEVVTIELCDGSNVIEFARYILEHAKTLEQIGIIYLARQSDVIQKLNESKMKSKATVIFQEEQAR